MKFSRSCFSVRQLKGANAILYSNLVARPCIPFEGICWLQWQTQSYVLASCAALYDSPLHPAVIDAARTEFHFLGRCSSVYYLSTLLSDFPNGISGSLHQKHVCIPQHQGAFHKSKRSVDYLVSRGYTMQACCQKVQDPIHLAKIV